jgi:hypothetical protein
MKKLNQYLCSIAVLGVLMTWTPMLSTCQPGSTGTSATYTQAHDPVVVNAEKTLRISKDTFDLLLKLEHENAADAAKISPKIHEFAEYLRGNAPNWLISANNLKNTYKHNRTSDNKANLLTALATLDQATAEARTYINQIQTKTP